MEKRLSNAKILGVISSILLALTAFLPEVEIILWIVGSVLLLISLNIMSDIFNDKRLFKNILKSFVIILAGITLALLVLLIAGVITGTSLSSLFTELMEISLEEKPTINNIPIIFIIVLYLSYLYSSYYFKKAMDLLYEYTKIKLFRYGGLLYFISAILFVVVFLSTLADLIAFVLIAIGFFTIPEDITSKSLSEKT
ncbi:DUF996 domain-containing protein [Thermodesulfobacterium sp. TA1]|uniref:DUF996 domain-containing protein n=1 Tax=Thermodesulfobacterium sp. TA1 TaxID=2234087 RepID=UPI0012319153|nr:DUF996 domain-containing protein [Thermodesulfobacterium sp. TA1]QER42726.1 DUF996 domain-containing protein [Thermodesulfobacterium sp. TA1]